MKGCSSHRNPFRIRLIYRITTNREFIKIGENHLARTNRGKIDDRGSTIIRRPDFVPIRNNGKDLAIDRKNEKQKESI